MKNVSQKFTAAINYIESLSNVCSFDYMNGNRNPDFHLEKAKHLLKLAGQPDRGMKIIHVAGTSGKGTTVNLIYNILQAAKFKVGAHFSPYVSVPTEKIQINNRFISMQEFVDLVEEAKPIIEKCYKTFAMPSHTEIWFLLALMYFRKQKCDFVVLETACGGRYDATNAILKSHLSVITNIGIDHIQILGNTFAQIAFEKAGIIRHHGNVFTTVDRRSAQKVIIDVAKKQNATLTIVKNSSNPNEALARAVAESIGIDAKAIARGINQARLPARFELMQKNPLVILDGAHNHDKIAFLTKKINKLPYRKLHLVCALTENREAKECFESLMPSVDYIYATRFLTSFKKAKDPNKLGKELRSIRKVPTNFFLDPDDALNAALKKATKNDLILIAGSFYLCGDLRKKWFSEDKQLRNRKNF